MNGTRKLYLPRKDALPAMFRNPTLIAWAFDAKVTLSTDRLVLLTFAAISRSDNTVVDYKLHTVVGCERVTLEAALKRLQARGLLEPVFEGPLKTRTMYRLLPPTDAENNLRLVGMLKLMRDAFRR